MYLVSPAARSCLYSLPGCLVYSMTCSYTPSDAGTTEATVPSQNLPRVCPACGGHRTLTTDPTPTSAVACEAFVRLTTLSRGLMRMGLTRLAPPPSDSCITAATSKNCAPVPLKCCASSLSLFKRFAHWPSVSPVASSVSRSRCLSAALSFALLVDSAKSDSGMAGLPRLRPVGLAAGHDALATDDLTSLMPLSLSHCSTAVFLAFHIAAVPCSRES